MTYLLDTNVISELRRPRQADRRVLRWFDGVDQSETFISAITIAELEEGAARADLRGKPHAAALRQWIDEHVLRSYAGRILPFDEKAALRFGRLQAPDPRSYPDVAIAATAIVNGLTVVTRNVKHFSPLGVPFFDPWEHPA
jgi:predicted nucleic acid-binding protein